MYTKLFKNFVTKNLPTFLLILVSITLSLFGYIFSDALSKNFLGSIEKDAQKNLGGDYSIQLGNQGEKAFDAYYADFKYNSILSVVRDYSIFTSVEINEIQSITLHYVDTQYPFYGEFEKTIINEKGSIILSEDTYIENEKKAYITLLGKEYLIKGYYQNVPSVVSTFLSDDHAFIDFSEYSSNVTNDNNTLIEKTYFFKNSDDSLFDTINDEFKKESKNLGFRLQDYKSGGERFADILQTLRSYINYAILFSFFLTVTIIFLSCSSFFIKEKKEISILRLLGMRNKQFIVFYVFLFSSILIVSSFLAIFFSMIAFEIMQNFDATQGFAIQIESIIRGVCIGGLLLVFSTLLPIIKFLGNEATSGLREDFFTHFSRKESIIGISFFAIMIISLSQVLGYSIISSLITACAIIIFIFIFYYINNFLLHCSYSKSKQIRKKNFILFDAMRTSIAPGNMSLLLNISFFIIFSIGLFILLLFGNFYNRLAVNLESDNNFFALNIDSDTYNKLDDSYKENAFSLIKGRISTINGESLTEHLGQGNTAVGEGSRGGARRFTREFNMTDNSLSNIKILKGSPLVEGTVSVDNDFARDLKVDVGDVIVFQIYGIEKELTISNIRESQDYSINPFFYFQINPKEFEKFPKLYFISDYVDTSQMAKTKKYFFDLSAGAASFIEVDKILEELKIISQKVLLVIQSLFLYIALFCILSIVVVGLFFRQFQKQNAQLYHLIGFTHQQNKIKNFCEYGYLATLMLVFSILIISFLVYYILSKNSFLSFDLVVYFQSIGLIIGVYLILMLGTWFSIRVEK